MSLLPLPSGDRGIVAKGSLAATNYSHFGTNFRPQSFCKQLNFSVPPVSFLRCNVSFCSTSTFKYKLELADSFHSMSSSCGANQSMDNDCDLHILIIGNFCSLIKNLYRVFRVYPSFYGKRQVYKA